MKIIEIIGKNSEKWLCLLFANTKEDVSDADKVLPEGITLQAGSIVYTSTLDIAVLDENGSWVWK